MTAFLLVLMTLILIGALNRNHRRQAPSPPGPHGAHDQDDRDWARIQLDLTALGDASTVKTDQFGSRAA
jgi:cell division protein FtsL